MTNVIKAASPADFLRVVPSMLGYIPVDSLVIVPMAGTRSLGGLRLDLQTDDTAADFANTALGLVIRVEGITGYVAAVYTSDSRDSHGALLDALDAAAIAFGLPTLDLFTVGVDGWRSRFADGDLDQIKPDPRLAPLAATHTQPVMPAPMPGVIEAILEMIEGEEPPSLEAMPDFGDRLARAEVDLAELVVIALSPRLRDTALLAAVRGIEVGEHAVISQRAYEEGTGDYSASLAGTMMGVGVRPDPQRLEAALQACLLAASSVEDVPEMSSGVLSVASWLSWALGRSSHADWLAKRALADEPGHGLSEILVSFVAAGHLPEWAFTR